MISLKNVHLRLGGRPVLKGVDIQIREGECLAVVGPNGCGKSTLLKLVAGTMRPDSGEISRPTRSTIGYLPQEALFDSTHSLETELSSAFEQLQHAFREMSDLEHQMAHTDPNSSDYERILERYGELSHLVEHQDGYSFESQVRRVATGLGFRQEDLSRSCQEFSGGWKMRILLAKLLLERPDILLLDEPTNHLDLESMLWLEEWIRGSGRTVIMVSHERAFMDRLVDRVVCLETGEGDAYTGNYTNYLKQSEIKRQQRLQAYERQQQEIEQMEAFIRKFRYNAARASLVQSRVKQLEKIERLPPPFYGEAIYFAFPEAPPSYREVIQLEGLGKSYGDLQVFADVNLAIYRGQRIGLVGPNGAGKSTLMRILAGREKPTSGTFTLGRGVSVAYFAQEDTGTLTSEQTLLQAIEVSAPPGQAQRGRDLLGAFLFSGDEVEKPLSALSGGERTRFRMAQMLFSPANLLLLDEPTNHLDVTSRATVEKALKTYSGTVVVVSHDRVFMERVTDRIVEIKDGGIRTFPGNYGEYLEYERSMVIGDNSQPKESAQIVAQTKPERKQEYEENKARNRAIRSLQRRIASLEEKIEEQETLIAEIRQRMEDPRIATDYTQLASLTQQHTEETAKNLETLKEWEQLTNELETFSGER
ncbi:MAG TPA: ABC-F family ATP-binding cassette domain-containing protein [bacterium]|nr:ABC-F family ATP-binding cassette domain-containing protein [bacterium]